MHAAPVAGRSAQAVPTIESGRSGAIYLVQVSVDKNRLHWKMRGRILKADGDIDLVAQDEWLQRKDGSSSIVNEIGIGRGSE